MSVSKINLSEQFRIENFPKDIPTDDLVTYFTLSSSDLDQIPVTTQEYNRLGFAVQLCSLRFLGMFPKRPIDTPDLILDFLATQLKIKTNDFDRYGFRENTKLTHQRDIIRYLKFNKLNSNTSKQLYSWLLERTMEHEDTIFLIRLLCEKMVHEKIVRPGITTIEGMVSKARNESWEKTYRIVSPVMKSNKLFIQELLNGDDEASDQYAWLKSSPVANSSNAIIGTMEKIEFLMKKGIHKWDLSKINPNRLKFLFDLGKRSSKYQLQRMPAKKKYSIAVVLLKMTMEKVIDDVIEQFDRNLSDKHSRARRAWMNL